MSTTSTGARRMADGLLFGVAGWSYDDWKDVVYPRGCKDTLRAVAELVDV